MAHVIQSPRVFNEQNWNPLRFVVDNEHNYAEYACDRVDNKESYVKKLFVTGFSLVIGDVQKPIEYFLFHILTIHQIG